ncbi:hypothetical protein MCAP1_003392 [Malassezia caprae]|uniref:Glycoside hydrolase family 5 domain-containing protein n=1 Tax=Malassezia caprae TaxID=1381934 RepID=A0AAF0E8W6_9BASI|nr:hypothetical protein MCAP1_003392 [Malassezia caprae]
MVSSIHKVAGLLSLALGLVSAVPTSHEEPWTSPLSVRSNTVGNNCTVLSDYSAPWPVFFPPFDSDKADLMRYRFQSGVNLGSWFVTEKWMSPSLYNCAHDGEKGDLAILRGYGNSSQGIRSARARLQQHWDKWITADDFAKMHNEYQINAVRIPIGYWNLPGAQFTKGTPFEPWADVYKNCWKYVRRAIKMAADNNIGVLLDLHGAYGSQNGDANSGFNGFNVEFFQSQNEKRTKEALVWIANDLKDVTNFIGLELLNEPKDEGGLGWWYKTTAKAIHDIGGNAANLPIYFGNPAGPSNIAELVSTHSFTALDIHEYYTFTHRNTPEPDILKNILGHNSKRFASLRESTKNRLVIGEWSCGLDTGSLSGTKANHAAQRAEFCQGQVQSYRNSSSAMFFWSYKYENCEKWGGWCFVKMWGHYIKNYGGYGVSSVDSSKLPSIPHSPASGQSHSNFQGYKEGMKIALKLASQQPAVPLGFKYDYMQLTWNRHSGQNSGMDYNEYQEGFNNGLVNVHCMVESLLGHTSSECNGSHDKNKVVYNGLS